MQVTRYKYGIGHTLSWLLSGLTGAWADTDDRVATFGLVQVMPFMRLAMAAWAWSQSAEPLACLLHLRLPCGCMHDGL